MFHPRVSRKASRNWRNYVLLNLVFNGLFVMGTPTVGTHQRIHCHCGNPPLTLPSRLRFPSHRNHRRHFSHNLYSHPHLRFCCDAASLGPPPPLPRTHTGTPLHTPTPTLGCACL